MKQKLRKISALFAAATLLALLAGCASGNSGTDTASASALNVLVVARYASDEGVAEFGDTINGSFSIDGVTIRWTAMSMGDPDADAMTYMATMTKFSGMLAANEADLLILDDETAQRFGENGELFVSLGDAFSAGELAGFTHPQGTLPLQDEEGNLTGEQSEAVGVNLSSIEALRATTTSDMSAYIASNAKNAEGAKQLLKYLAGY